MPHTIIYSDRGFDLRGFLTEYSANWSPPSEDGYFNQQLSVVPNRYYANTNEKPIIIIPPLKWLAGDDRNGNLTGNIDHLGFVAEAPEGQTLKYGTKNSKNNFYGPIAKITVGWGVEAITPKKFVVKVPALTFIFEDLEATGLNSGGSNVITAFNKGNFNALFQNNVDDTTQIGGTGNDVMYGFGGTDVFVFSSRNTGKDTIRNFEANDDHDDHDVIRMSTDIYKNWDELKANISMRGTDTVIRIDNLNEIKIWHVNQRHIGEADFEFVSSGKTSPDTPPQHDATELTKEIDSIPHRIVYDDRGVDLKSFLLNAYQRDWDPPKPQGYFDANANNYSRLSGQYYANTNEKYDKTPGSLLKPVTQESSSTSTPAGLTADKKHLGFVIEAADGDEITRAFKHYDESYYGRIAKITVGYGVKADSEYVFAVSDPFLTFIFADLEANGKGSPGDTVIKAFNSGSFNRLFENIENDTTQISGRGNDKLYGFKGVDHFLFKSKQTGKDVIYNFTADDDHDNHDIIALSTDIYKNWNDLSRHISNISGPQHEHGTLIRIDDDNQIFVRHIDKKHMTEKDFLFLTPAEIEILETAHTQKRETRSTGDETFEYRTDTPFSSSGAIDGLQPSTGTIFSFVEI